MKNRQPYVLHYTFLYPRETPSIHPENIPVRKGERSRQIIPHLPATRSNVAYAFPPSLSFSHYVYVCTAYICAPLVKGDRHDFTNNFATTSDAGAESMDNWTARVFRENRISEKERRAVGCIVCVRSERKFLRVRDF